MPRRFRITPRALADLHDIGRYTAENWGKTQRDTYLAEIDARFAWLAQNPRAGKQRDDVAAGYYSFPQGSHVIFYLIGEDAIGIPHKQMDILNYFDAE